MDVHRCRFIPYPPSAINALAFSHPSSLSLASNGPPTLRLAIGRANGDIELWHPLKGVWYQENIIHGGKDRSIEGLVWTRDPEETDGTGFKSPGRLRLFSIGYSSSVTEWDLAAGKPARHASANYGEIWCISAQPRWQSLKELGMQQQGTPLREGEDTTQSIAVGCADGSIVLLSTADGNLQFQRTVTRPPKRKARVLSITFQNRHTLVTGHADSTVRIFDIRNGRLVRAMSLGGGSQGGPKEVLVWSVKCTTDGTIISGDSTGTVSFWDAKNHSRLQRITSHKADILDVATSMDGHTVVSGGMDRRTTLYRLARGSKPGEKNRWIEIAHQRFHEHDVKAMATFETKRLSVLASGGLDTSPIMVPLREFGNEYHRALPNLPQQPPVRSAPLQRLIISWWDREVSVWRILANRQGSVANLPLDESLQDSPRKLAAKIALQKEESITCADISSDGSLLAVSTMAENRVFFFKPKLDSTLRVQKLDIPSSLVQGGAKMLRFSPDQMWLLIVRSDNKIQLFRIKRPPTPIERPEFISIPINLRRLNRQAPEPNYLHGTLGPYTRSVSRVAFSADSRIIVVSDLSGFLDSWVLSGLEDPAQDDLVAPSDNGPSDSASESSEVDEEHRLLIFGQHWLRNPTASQIPKLPSAPIILSFRPSSPSSNKALTNGITPPHPTRHNPHPHSHELPSGEDRLFILTVEHRIYEFNIVAGKLSDWSRRNPTSTLPDTFRRIKDRAMGCVWDTSALERKNRLWLYGSNWLWMFDLSRDFPRVEAPDAKAGDEEVEDIPADSKKRRREGRRVKEKHFEERRRGDTGAGDRIDPNELTVGLGSKIRKRTGPGGGDVHSIHLERERSPSTNASGSDDEYGTAPAALVRSRRRLSPDLDDGADSESKVDGESSAAKARWRPWWYTYKYRPILGLVPIGGAPQNTDERVNGDDARTLEVVLVERPMFEVNLPPRYYGDQEWSEMKDKV
ncbi:MAG: hypothetical protein LQ351_000103 [Letrouitia transgressa]|nr:MAG: hypothetical protein LQ351_000103 [Letrouitia transgressa]